MSNFPNSLDDDVTLTPVNDNITEIGEQAIMDLRDAVFAIEEALGIQIAGSAPSLADRISVALDAAGNIKSSALTSIGLVTLPITQDQIALAAGIPESKLQLDHRTQDLFNYIRDLSSGVNEALGWISITGSKLEPHLLGFIYRHALDQIDVVGDPNRFLKNKFGLLRDNTDAFTVVNDMNDELLAHQFADGSPFGIIKPVTTNNGSVYPSNYAHTASGIFLNTTRFEVIPQSAQDLQQFAEFIDSSSIFLFGSRIQNFYSNGISRVSRSSSLPTDGYGQHLVPPTPAIAYLLNDGYSSSPFDDIDAGDDIIEFKPAASDISSNSFDEKFALVKIGDIIRINYGTFEVAFVIKEKKYIQSGGNKKYVVRIAGKNFFHSLNAVARIDRPLFNNNKPGVLSLAPANNAFSEIPSLIIGQPRGAQALGIGFDADQLDASHYLLYLALYPNGSPQDGYFIIPAIDVTGNKGATPGEYTLDSVIEATNNAFRVVGYNYRFIAFSYQGEFGIMLAEPYGNASFSILSAVVAPNGGYDSNATNLQFPNNVVGIFPSGGLVAPDPLGFGPFSANIASPPFMMSYGSAEASQIPTKLFVPLKRNNYYVNGVERDKLALEVGQALDGYGDGYWVATVQSKNIFPGSPPTGRVETTYRIPLDLSTSTLKAGKTLVVQSLGQGTFIDFGRFIIKGVNFSCAPDVFTDITVYDAVHATGVSPQTTLAIGSHVGIYFGHDSVSFNKESATDFSAVAPFKRHFEVFIDQDGKTFTHERARINISSGPLTVNGTTLYTYSELEKLNIIKVSPKLRGYLFGSVTKIALHILSFEGTTGDFNGYLSSYDGVTFSKKGPLVFGRMGHVVRFYDETNIDFIDLIFDVNVTTSSFTDQVIDFQLFPTLSLYEEVMLIGTCQLNDSTETVNYVRDERQFGNVGEKDLTTSALNFIALPEKLFHSNGVVRGFDLSDASPNPDNGQLYLTGGVVLVNGKIKQINNETVVIPLIKEFYSGSLYNVNWLLCVNDGGEYQPIPMLDFDSSLATPNNTSRVFKAFNPINGQYYFLDASTFSDAINIRKDLTPIYIIAATVNEISKIISLQIADVRRYINDADTNFPLKLTSANAQGNFKNPEAILNWIKYNNSFNGRADVKGATISSGVISLALILDFANSVIIEGENDAVLTFNNNITIGSNITFKDLSINFNGGLSVKSGSQNVVFDGCTIAYTAPVTPPTNNIIFDFSNGNDIVFKDCAITATYTTAASGGAVFNLNNTTNFSFEKSSVDVDFDVVVLSQPPLPPGDVFSITNSPDVNITGSQFFGNFNRFVFNSASSGLRITNSLAQSTFDPSIAPNFSYDTTDLVNTGQGYVYSNVSATLSDIYIDNVIFNYSPLSASSERFSFVNFELSSPTSILSGLTITNCKFNHITTSTTNDDFKPAISIINTASGTTTLLDQPIVVDTKISNNKCNRNQSIVLTSKTVSSLMRIPGLTTLNVSIDNNICGTIGYWVAGETKVVNLSPNVSASSDKISGLFIFNNTCHDITNVDHRGQYYLVSRLTGSGGGLTTNMCGYPSGNVIIEGNDTNWIHVGIAQEEVSSLKIMNNVLSAYNTNYLATYGDTQSNSTSSGNIGSHGFAIFVNANKHSIPSAQAPGEGNDSSCVIVGNVTNTGYWMLLSSSTFVYNYTVGYIYCQSSNTITHNVLKGGAAPSGGGGSLGHLILVGGVYNTVSHNKIFRVASTITSYIGFYNYEVPLWDGAGASGMIVDNTFDSPYINDATLDENVVKFRTPPIDESLRWIVERNKNQTGYLSIPLTNSGLALSGINSPTTKEGFLSTNGNATYVTFANNPGGTMHFSSLVLKIHDEDSAVKFYGWQENLDKHLPNGVRILQLKMGVRQFLGGQLETPFNVPFGMMSGATLYLNNYITSVNYTNMDYFANANSTDNNVVTSFSSVLNATAINSTSNTLFMTIDTPPNNDDNFVTGQGYPFSASLSIFYRIFSASVDLFFSPLFVKYRW